MDKKILLLVNPQAGRQKIRQELVSVVDVFTKAGFRTEIYTTQNKETTRKLLADSEGSFETVVCCGGDGTFNETLSGTMLWQEKPVIGYIPAGTTNDFASGVHLPVNIKEAAEVIAKNYVRRFDAGLFNDYFFSYVASFGAFTETSYSTPQNVKNTIGHMAYILEGIREIPNITAYHIKIAVNGKTYEDDYIFGTISNARSVGGILKMDASVVDLNDGLFEVMMVRNPKTLIDISTIIASLNSRRYDPSMFLFLQTDQLVIETEKELVWSLDGERVVGERVTQIQCIRDAFQLITTQ